MDKTFKQMINELVEAAFQHGMTANNFMVLGCGYDPDTTNALVDQKRNALADSLYNIVMADHSHDEELNELIEEFLDYISYFGPDGGVGLEFDTRISILEREKAEELIKLFIKYAKNEKPDAQWFEDMMMGRDVEDDS